MDKKIALFSVAMALTIPIVPVFAQVSDLAVKPAEGETRGKRAQVQQAEDVTRPEKPEVGGQRKELTEKMQQKRLEFEDRKEKMAEEKCKNIENKIANRVNRYENNGQMLQKVYGNMKTRLQRLSAQLKAAGADTTKLDADLVVLNGKIDKLYADHAAFMFTLKETKTFVCGKTEGEFKTKIEQARKVPETIKQDRADIKNFFQTTIKADLEAIKTTLGLTTEAPEVEAEADEKTSVKVNKEKRNRTIETEGTTSVSSSSSSTTATSGTVQVSN